MFVQFELSQLVGVDDSAIFRIHTLSLEKEWIDSSIDRFNCNAWYCTQLTRCWSEGCYPHHSMVSFKLRMWHCNPFHPLLLHFWVMLFSPNPKFHFTHLFHAPRMFFRLFLEWSLISWHCSMGVSLKLSTGPPVIIDEFPIKNQKTLQRAAGALGPWGPWGLGHRKKLVGGEWLTSILFSQKSWESHHPNWRTPSFFRGLALAHQPEEIRLEHPMSSSLSFQRGCRPEDMVSIMRRDIGCLLLAMGVGVLFRIARCVFEWEVAAGWKKRHFCIATYRYSSYNSIAIGIQATIGEITTIFVCDSMCLNFAKSPTNRGPHLLVMFCQGAPYPQSFFARTGDFNGDFMVTNGIRAASHGGFQLGTWG